MVWGVVELIKLFVFLEILSKSTKKQPKPNFRKMFPALPASPTWRYLPTYPPFPLFFASKTKSTRFPLSLPRKSNGMASIAIFLVLVKKYRQNGEKHHQNLILKL
jgi:hypothetical protein